MNSRSLVRLLLGLVISLAVVAIYWTAAGVSSAPHVTQRLDGNHIKGINQVVYVDGQPVFKLSLDDGVIRRPKLGIFRIGFVRELVAKNLAVDILVGEQTAKDFDPRSARSALDKLANGSGKDEPTITSMTIEGASLRLRDPAGDLVEIRAQSCSAGITTFGRVFLRSVSLRINEEHYELATLEYDPFKRTFTTATAFAEAGPGRMADERAAQAAVQNLNAVLGRMLPVAAGGHPVNGQQRESAAEQTSEDAKCRV